MTAEKTTEPISPRYVAAANELLDEAIRQLKLKNDAALARAMEMGPPIVSKIRSGQVRVGPATLIRLHEVTGWAVRTMKVALGEDCLEQRAA